jgi:homoserine kinase
VTLSGAGPTVVVWARKEQEGECVDELRRRLPDAQVLPLEVAAHGAEEEKGH